MSSNVIRMPAARPLDAGQSPATTNPVAALIAAIAPATGAAAFAVGLLAMLASISLIFAGGVLLIMSPP